jgi:elongation factor Ts
MADITASMVKELRDRTQAGMNDCKQALVEATGDMEKAVEIILKKGLVKAAAKAGRVAAEGEIATCVSPDGKRGVIVEVNCQTDFVARGDDFKGFVRGVLQVAAKTAVGADLLVQTFPGSVKTVDQVRAEIISKTGENCVVRRWDALEAPDKGGLVHSYVHAGGKLAVLLRAQGPEGAGAEFREFIDNVAMQVAAMRPVVVSSAEISPEDVAKQKEIFEAQLEQEKKPRAAWPKIVEGKLAKWYTEVTLLGQVNVWDPPAGSIDGVRRALANKLGSDVKLVSFFRYELGEGIEKKKDDLAAEVAKMAGS